MQDTISPKKILVIRFSSIGDIVLTSPVLRCLRAQRPGWQIHFLTKKIFQPVVAHNPNIDRVHYLEDDLEATIRELKKEQFDFVADLHHNARTLRVKQALGAKAASFPKKNIRKWILTNMRINAMPDESIVTRYFEAVKPLGIVDDGGGLDYYIPQDMETTNDDIPASHWNGYVGCVIGGSYATKQMPAEQWREFCAKVPFPVMLIGGIDDRDLGTQIAALDDVKIYNACGKFKFNESADLVRRARVVVSHDTGLMHVAAAFRKNIVSLWGNTSPELGMFPYFGANTLKTRVSPKSVLMEVSGLHCHPCSKLGYDKCPRGHFKCMRRQDVDKMVAAVAGYWKE